MKISKSTRPWAFIAASLVFPSPTLSLQPLYQPDGAVLGNVDTLDGMSPRVVLDYLASCANVTGIETVQGSDCLFENYIYEQFPGPTWGNVCSPPNITIVNITANLLVAASKCSGDIQNDLQTASVLIMKVIAMESCWEELCEREDISLRIESQYIEACSDVELPYPVEFALAMFPTDDEMVDGVLTCMLDFVMDMPPFQFGLPDPPSPCYPPGYENISAVCSSVLAPQAFAGCIDAYYFEFEDDDMKMSFDYEMSMKNPDQDDDEKEDVDLFVIFCDILEGLTTERGLECLDDICQAVTTAPSGPPSGTPSSPPGSPTTSPTGSPTGSPTASPTDTSSPMGSPTASPTDPPTGPPTASPVSPTAAPAGSPTASPTGAPSGSPTDSPTASPTDFPTGAPTSSTPGPPTPSPTGSPTASPTDSPTGAPTASTPGSPTPFPTGSPTTSPTDSPTGAPTVSPTPWPSVSPSKSPRSSPSTPPSASPLAAPSESPTATPTVIVTNQDIAQSSAAFVPTVSILGLSFLVAPLLIL